MSDWISFAAMVVLMYGLGARDERREDRQWDLDRLSCLGP